MATLLPVVAVPRGHRHQVTLLRCYRLIPLRGVLIALQNDWYDHQPLRYATGDSESRCELETLQPTSMSGLARIQRYSIHP